MADLVGQQFGSYRLTCLLGQGGFADVYLGEHQHLTIQAAIKILRWRLVGSDIEQFRAEAQTIATFSHEHIIRLLDFGIKDDIAFLVMDYAPGGTVRSHHPKGSRLPILTMLSYVKQVASALQYAHDNKLIHRDIKPENMLLGKDARLLLSDFGLALLISSSSSRSTKEIAGTVPYMAPEQIQGKARPASDQYALGVVVYEWLSGTQPFSGSPLEIYGQHLHMPPPPLHQIVPNLSPAIEEVVIKSLAKDPKQRFASVQAFAEALHDAVQSSTPLQNLSASPHQLTPQQSVLPSLTYNLPHRQTQPPFIRPLSRQEQVSTFIKTLPFQESLLPDFETAQDQLLPDDNSSAYFEEAPSNLHGETALLDSLLTPAITPLPAQLSLRSLSSSTRKRRRFILVSIALTLLLVIGTIAYRASGNSLQLAKNLLATSSVANGTALATISIMPVSKTMKNNYSIRAVMGAPDAARHQISIRTLTATTPSQSHSANATGKSISPATAAHGMLTIKACDTGEVISPGNSWTVSNTNSNIIVFADISTSQTVPSGGNCAQQIYESLTFPARTQQVGAYTNIQPSSVNYDAEGIVLVNNAQAFTGGQDAKSNTIVQQNDIDTVAKQLMTTEPQAQQALQTQLHTYEQFLISPVCTPKVNSDHPAGDNITSFTVTVSFNCAGEVYDQQSAKIMALQWFQQDAEVAGYRVEDSTAVVMTQSSNADATSSITAIPINVEGIWAWQFSPQQEQTLTSMVAGKNQQDALSLLQRQQGVGQVKVTLPLGKSSLPTDAGQIKVTLQNSQ